jgi:Mg-chelatase subunit ChlD
MLLRRLVQDRTAGIVPLLAIAIIPIIGAVGAAVDYSRAANMRTALQAALDSTALMLSKDAQKLSGTEVNQKAADYFKALFQQPDAFNVQITSVYSEPAPGSFALKVTGSASLNTTFMRIYGHLQTDITAFSEVVWGVKRLELALALDNTGSMATDGKMAALKTAAHNLLDTLKNAAKTPDDIKVAIIPFDTTVHVGTEYMDEFWIDYSVNNIQKKKWKGCVEDRDQSNDVLDTAPASGSNSTYFPAEACGSLAKAMPLTSDWTALHAKVDQMSPSGYTNVTIGLVWAWHALTGNTPFPQGSPAQPDLDKVIILLTDGENTRNRWTTSTYSIDKRTTVACDNIKAANIKLYTVRVIEGNATLLKNCATKPDMYYDVQEADQLNAAFSAIAQNLANLRIAK